jgi:hypothetical protein
MITSWFAQIDRSKSVTEVLSVARDYLATWTPPELALLPERCRPARLRDAEDVESLHSTLVEEYRVTRVSGMELELLQRLTSFIVRASIRLSELAPPSSGGPDDSPGDPERSLSPRER